MTRLPLLFTLPLLLAASSPADSSVRAAGHVNESSAVLLADTSAVVVADAATREAFDRVMRLAGERDLAARPLGEIIHAVGEHFLGVPYVAHVLEGGEAERLVVSLTGFDCVLYNENVLALAQTIQAGAGDFSTYARNVHALRYRGGVLIDYCSRLHYFSDWLRDNERRGQIEIITDRLPGARPFNRRVHFMSTNRAAYAGLRSDPAHACIADVERRLNAESFSYIPQDRIAGAYGALQTGDLIAITTNVEGLDIAHTGFVYKWPDGRTGFIHASTTGQIVRAGDLARYVQGNRRQTGIMVARAVPVRESH